MTFEAKCKDCLLPPLERMYYGGNLESSLMHSLVLKFLTLWKMSSDSSLWEEYCDERTVDEGYWGHSCCHKKQIYACVLYSVSCANLEVRRQVLYKH